MKKMKTIGFLSAAAFFILVIGVEAAYANPFDPLHNRSLRNLVLKPVKIEPVKPVKIEPIKPVKRVKIEPIVIDGPIEEAEATLLPHEVEGIGLKPKIISVEPIKVVKPQPIKGGRVDPPEPPGSVEKVATVPPEIYPVDPIYLEETKPIGPPGTARVDGGGPPTITPVPKVDRKPEPDSPDAIAGDVVRRRAPKIPTEEERNRFKPIDLRNQLFGIGRR